MFSLLENTYAYRLHYTTIHLFGLSITKTTHTVTSENKTNIFKYRDQRHQQHDFTQKDQNSSFNVEIAHLNYIRCAQNYEGTN